MLSASNPRLSCILLLSLVALAWWSIHLSQPPQARPATAPLTDFSAERAMQYVRQIAREPHAMGTPDHARVRAYLLSTLRSLGLQPQVQEATVTGPMTSSASLSPSGAMLGVASRVGYAYNVMARLKGRRAGKALLLLAHYDSQPNTPGAADDGAGVAAILETIRAIRRGKPLQHDVIVLFTDGEEQALFGAKAFLRHPWAANVGFIMNLEARGNRGPSLTFELSSENGWIVKQVAEAAPYPMAASLMYEVYRKMPNYTDFTLFRKAGYAGINAGLLDGFVHYHKLTDSPENLDPNSLQHQGDNLLALARHIGNGPLDRLRAPDKVFFNLAGYWFMHYPMGLNWLWMALLTATFVLVLGLGFRQKQLTMGQVLSGLALYGVMLVLVGSVCFVVNRVILGALPLTHPFNGTYSSATFFVAYILLTVGMLGLLIRLTRRWLRPLSLVMGGYGLIYTLTLTSFVLLPAATYLFLFPLLSGLMGLLAVLWPTRRRSERQSVPALILLVAALPTLFMLLPTINLLFTTFDLQLPVASVLLLGLTFALLLPLWLLIDAGPMADSLPIGLLLLGVEVAFIATRNEVPTTNKPLHSQVAYFMNTDTKQAVWASYGLLTTDEWNQQFFVKPSIGTLTGIVPDAPKLPRQLYLKSPADLATATPPVAEIVSDTATGPLRRLTLNLRSPRGGANLEALLCPQTAENVKSVWINGELLELKAQQTTLGPAYDLLFFGLPVTKKITLTVDLAAGSPLRIMLYDQSVGLPMELVKIPRPAHVVPEQGRSSNLTVVGKTYQF